MTPQEHSPSRSIGELLLLFFLATLIIIVEYALFKIRWAVLLVIIGLGLGILISPVLVAVKEKWKIPFGMSAFLFVMVSFLFLFGLGFLFFTVVSKQLYPLLKELPVFASQMKFKSESIFKNYPGLKMQFSELNMGESLKGLPEKITHGIHIGASILGGFIFMIALALYIALNPTFYLFGVLSFFHPSQRPRVQRILQESAAALRRWFGSQLIAMGAVGVGTSLGLWIVGLDYWLLFGIITALLDIVPLIGPIISAAVVILVTLASHPNKIWWVLGTFIVIHQLEAHVVIPLVMKGRIQLPPVHLMVLMLFFGSWFGILGLLVAPGLLAVSRTIYLMARATSLDSITPGRERPPEREALG